MSLKLRKQKYSPGRRGNCALAATTVLKQAYGYVNAIYIKKCEKLEGNKHREMVSANKALGRADHHEATASAQPTRGMIYLN